MLSYRFNHNDKGAGIFNIDEIPTKKQVLSLLMSIYDPLGLIFHLVVHGKILMQELHKYSKQWDILVPDELYDQWLNFLRKLKQAEGLSIPRCILTEHAPIELHVFVDTSEKALAAFVYARTETSFGINTQLITAKTRVVPIKPVSIPRLELHAAVMGTRLLDVVQKEIRLEIKSATLWTDSKTVLAWITNTKRKYTSYINVRVGEILDTTAKDQWRWVSSENNPADEATKEYVGEPKWFNGPKYFESPSESWTLSGNQRVTEIEEILFYGECDLVNENDFSDWWRLLRRYHYITKFIIRLRQKRINFTASDRRYVENILYRKAQWESFPVEMESLISHGTVPASTKLIKLNPFLDEFGVMRSRGRLEYATGLPQRLRTPIILPQKHHITKLIVRSVHERYLHRGDNTVIGVLQLDYWIMNVRAVLRNVKKCCQKCILMHAKPANPFMAPLPTCRTLLDVPPFTNTGVDYFGPFEVLVHRSTEKRWGVIFTCLSSRAVHIEMAEKMDTDTFLMCLSNFQSIRGRVSHLFSDNGTNFIGANNELNALVRDIDRIMDQEQAAKLKVQWTFNPPAAPHFGGVWERLIKGVKESLNVLLDSFPTSKPRPETLRSALTKASAILNSRPLTHIPIDNIDDEVLTPFHFLILRPGDLVPPYAPETSGYERKQWKIVQHVCKQFWDRWKK
ncbi:uncharacterized protein LOC129729296 [Wyeomyia smithii]|uniref:uncharacterized protein LOC129729296 n=1 Tax=Wyeomyia smithii TaxID=174621 RepID=UPI002467B47C|nr:uncharacterized protein LOC129729296 [Wyeomyia smithii]